MQIAKKDRNALFGKNNEINHTIGYKEIVAFQFTTGQRNASSNRPR